MQILLPVSVAITQLECNRRAAGMRMAIRKIDRFLILTMQGNNIYF